MPATPTVGSSLSTVRCPASGSLRRWSRTIATHATARVLVQVLDPSPDRIGAALSRSRTRLRRLRMATHRDRCPAAVKVDIVRDALRRLGHFDPPPFAETVPLAPWAFRTTGARLRGERSRRFPPCGFARLGPRERLPRRAPAGCRAHRRRPLSRCRRSAAPLRRGTGERMAAVTPAKAKTKAIAPADVRSDHIHEFAAGRSWQISAKSFFQTRADGVDAPATLVMAAAADCLGAAAPCSTSTAASACSPVRSPKKVDGHRGRGVRAAAAADARANLGDLAVDVVHRDVTTWAPPSVDLVVADPVGPAWAGGRRNRRRRRSP